ncbi:DUF1015 family protein [Euzebya tangerina]|uniref:DUF1015 family protein n=1 Tax=Euzebya tangerina TaxID=591198 RepID=UPI000E313DFB|nr:DUF1015 family protein [Euzebya tangerina]
MHIQPTAARLVQPALAEQVVIPALDSLSTDDRDRIRARNPWSYLHALQEPVDLEAATIRAAAVHSGEGLARLVDAGVFEPGPAEMYAYRMRSGGLTQVSVVATVPVEEYDSVILPHEKTRPARVAYLSHYRATVGYVSSPVAVAHPPSAAVDEVLTRATQSAPLLDFVTADGNAQTVWGIEDTAAATAAFAGITRAYVSDGHHRVEAARTVPGDRDRLVLTALTSTRDVDVAPFHRLVRGADVDQVLGGLEEVASVEDLDGSVGPAPGSVWVGLGRDWWSGQLPAPVVAEVPESMDAARLHAQVLDPLGFEQSDPRLQYVPGLGSPRMLADAHPGTVVIALAPATFDDIIAAAEAGRTLPLKSTYVRPKPHSGVFLAPT